MGAASKQVKETVL